MKLIETAPYEVRKIFEKLGIEESELSRKGSNLYVDCEDFDLAYQVRSSLLEGESFSCRLISNSLTGKPTVEIEQAIN